MYAKIIDGSVGNYPYSIEQLRKDNPNTSFPSNPSPQLLAEFGMVTVVVTGQPEHDYTNNCTESTPEYVDGQWQQVWVVTDASEDEIAARTEAKANEVRAERNNLLSQSDWTQLDDSPQGDKLAWAVYRQTLRDVPAQAGFPWTVEWPQQPE
jgi:RNA polymerase subunit RPABC4/transcription elongation factor Spt4